MGILQLLVAAVGPVIDAPDATLTHTLVGGPAVCGYELNSDGFIYHRKTGTGGAYVAQTRWVTNGTPGNYEVVWTAGTGTVDTTPGAAGSALNLGTSRRWEETSAINALESATFTLIIRPAGGGTTIDGAAISLTADGQP